MYSLYIVLKNGVKQNKKKYTLFWRAVDKLSVCGFTTAYVNVDGAQSNRSFMHMHGIQLRSMNLNVTSSGLLTRYQKIRNNIMKSGIKKVCTRNLELPDKTNIQWQMWVDAFNWDKISPLQIHRALTQVHVYPNTKEKMRNHLAEEVLNDDMLNLMTQYQASLGQNGASPSGSIDMLKHTSKMIRNFHDQRPIFQANDMRLHEKIEILQRLKRWEETIAISDDTSTAKSKKLLSRQCIEDLYACILGFDQVCRKAISMSGHIEAQINYDVENDFCQQRATYNGPNSHPNALQYRRNLNNIILGQSSLSRKGNAVTKRANVRSPLSDTIKIFFISLFRNSISLFRNSISFKRNSISLFRNSISFKRNSISLFRNSISLFRNSISFKRNNISLFRNSISFKRNSISLFRNSISFKRNNISLFRNSISLFRNSISFKRNSISLFRKKYFVLSKYFVVISNILDWF
ncbi:hypothetical protein ACJMK2_039831 [Sinanodonta woodiana]|uniref:Uncharacterized protein n=1 Tax=Sinanodonta woodiana TaxID=1069815 RepID=A0ABD3WD58_SINWO